jgi:hypothetical protein
MVGDQDDDGPAIPKATPATAEEIAEFEKNVRQLIRFRSGFDKNMRFLDERLREKEQRDKKTD